MATDANLDTQPTGQSNDKAERPALDPAKCQIVLPQIPEKVAAQACHHLDPGLSQAGYSEDQRTAAALETAVRCCERGGDNIEYAGINTKTNSIVVQFSGQNISNTTLTIDIKIACHSNPVENMGKLGATVVELKQELAETNKQLAEQSKQLAALKAQNEELRKSQEQAQQAKAQGGSAKTGDETAKTGGTPTDGEQKKSGGLFSWLGKAIDDLRERVQKFVVDFIQHPFETIGKIIDCALGYGRHHEQAPAQQQNQQQAQPEVTAQPAAAMRLH